MIESTARNQLQDSSKSKTLNFLSSSCNNPIDIEWNNLTVKSSKALKKLVAGKKTKFIEEKTILNNVSGHLRHGTFTAIMGPSGCGKTTLLNVFSNRSDNKLSLAGSLNVNSQAINSIESIANMVAFVQQDDILMATSTPREVFTFYAKLRLDLSADERKFRVAALLEELGLTKCADTKVGNELIRGLSGGERRRTSIGVELIANPSLIFLDEPTTGLDSTTALMIVELLRDLAKSGRTIVSTIHQPSSEIFEQFDNLMLMVRGNIIYTGAANKAVHYFDGVGYPCPKLTNPSDHFMKIMSETGLIMDEMKNSDKKGISLSLKPELIEDRFKGRLDGMVQSYRNHKVNIIEDPLLKTPVENSKLFQTSWFSQFYLVLIRALVNAIKNPIDVVMRLVQFLVFGGMILILWAGLANDLTGVQDRNGALFMIVTTSVFITMSASMSIFSLERPIFLREQNSKAYRTSAYFWGTTLAEIPFFIIFSVILVCMTYWGLGLNDYSPNKVWIAILINILACFASSGYGVVMSTFVPNVEIANAIMSMIMTPFFATGGFFVSWSYIPYHFYEFAYLTPFRYGYQAMFLNEYTDLDKLTCTSDPKCRPLETKEFDESLEMNLIILAVIGVAMRVISYLGLVLISTPKKAKLEIPKQDEKATL
jgi:ABC-type multidrug transport system ATPase subunit/ABC-type multidrug transport system permease subunit